MNEPNGKHPNVVDMAEARRRQKTLKRQGAQAGAAKGGKSPNPTGNKFWAVIQVVLFMLVLYLGIRSCGGGHL